MIKHIHHTTTKNKKVHEPGSRKFGARIRSCVRIRSIYSLITPTEYKPLYINNIDGGNLMMMVMVVSHLNNHRHDSFFFDLF